MSGVCTLICNMGRRDCKVDSPCSSASVVCDRNSSSDDSPPVDQQQKFRIFYAERGSAFDLTEFQVRAIMLLASQEMESGIQTKRTGLSLAHIESLLHGPPCHSMKRSLQKFLQQRKKRTRTTSSSCR